MLAKIRDSADPIGWQAARLREYLKYLKYLTDRTSYGPGIWGHTLRDQLKVDQEAFWACLSEGRIPDRGAPTAPHESLPADLVHLLLSRVGLTEDEVRHLSKPEAVARLQEYWLEGV